MPANISRRELLAGAGAGAAALLIEPGTLHAQPAATRAVVFTNTTVVTVDLVQDNVALAVVGDRIAAIGPTEAILKSYPNAETYDGRGKALFPGLINCHAHMGAVLARGFNEDFGFPNSAKLAVQPNSLLQGEEATLMVTVAALEAMRTAESVRDSENVAGPMAPDGLAKSLTPRFSQKLRDEGMQRIAELHGKWHGANQGRISVPLPFVLEDNRFCVRGV